MSAYLSPLELENPQVLGLPHTAWRPNQLAAFETALRMHKGLDQFGFLESGRPAGGFLFTQQPTGCHAKGQLLLMADGHTIPVEIVQVGDKLMGMDGTPRRVLSLVHGFGKLHRVIPVKGSPFVVTGDHLLTLVRTNTHGSYRTSTKVRSDCLRGNILDVSVFDYYGWSKTRKHIHKLLRVGVPFTEKSLPIDPYFLGVILGDGCTLRRIDITTPDPEIVQEVYSQAATFGLQVRVSTKPDSKASTYCLTMGNSGGRLNPITGLLRSLGLADKLSGEKFVPFDYKTASVDQRYRILAGLLDTDGYFSKSSCDYISKSQTLADDVTYIARSLGLAAYLTPCQKFDQNGHGGTYFRVSISGELSLIPCRVARRKCPSRQQIKSVLRTGFRIETVGEGEYFGFTLDGDGRYLLDDFTVTHNSGKSGVATALGAFDNVTALVGTLNLVTQYHEQYSFSAIKGRANYPCADQDKIMDWGGSTLPTAADCHMRAMHQCKFAGECEYLIVKEEALAARRLVVTYPYAMLSHSVQERDGILVCDEAHAVVDEIIGFSTFEVSPRYCERWGLPDFPLPEYGEENRGDVLHPYSLNLLLAWFDASIAILAARKTREGKLSRAHAAHAHLKLYRNNIATLPQEDWFLEVHPSPICVFRLRPLTAVVAAKLLFTKHKATVILMSATIGDPAPLASELGIENYAWEDYPHPIPVSARPVFDLGLERMTHENLKRNPSLFRVQAQTIRAWMATLNPAWRGIILAPSYTKIRELADVLVPACPDRNFLVQKAGNTVADITDSFLRYRNPGDVLIASIQGFGHGLDLRGDLARWCVVAGVPHSNPFDRYEQLRKQRNGKFGWWQAYSAIPQAAGRVSRGELDDYGEPIVNVCALADGSATTPLAYKYYPSWFVEAIQKV